MIIVVYAATVVLFPILALLMGLIIAFPFGILIRSISGGTNSPIPTFLSGSVVAGILSMAITAKIWTWLGYSTGWLLVSILVVEHLSFASLPNSNPNNRTQAYGTAIGLLLFVAGRFFYLASIGDYAVANREVGVGSRPIKATERRSEVAGSLHTDSRRDIRRHGEPRSVR